MQEDNLLYIVAANSGDTTKTWYKIYKGIKNYGWRVYCVNPRLEAIDGERIYPDLRSLPEQGNVLVLVTRPEISTQLADDAIELGYHEIWFQPGAFSDSAAAKAEHNGLIVHNECFMTANNIW